MTLAAPEAGYRPHLDGLRAVAVYLVLLFHAGSSRFTGGFIGVDIFFVLSGYLVTLLLLRDLREHGAIRLGRFYARRFRRLLPAAFVALSATAMIYSATASPSDVVASLNGFKAAFLYVTNWFFIDRSTAYFGGNIEQNPVLHFWSLAVEEQFYLLWPLTLGAVFMVTRRAGAHQRRVVMTLVAIGGLASVAWALFLRGDHPERAYYGTDARAYQLLAGALLALAPGVIARMHRGVARLAAPLSILGLIALATSWVSFDAIERGVAVAALSCLAIAAIEADEGGVTQRVLGWGPLAYLGKVSYGTYLWHWPVILVITTTATIGTVSTIAFTAFVATGLASLSFQILEHPIRRSATLDRQRHLVIAAGLAISVVAATVLIPAILDPDATTAVSNTPRSAGTPVPTNLNFAGAAYVDLPPLPNCVDKPARECTMVEGRGKHILLIGDSHARMYIPAFLRIAQQENLTFSVVSVGGCPWALGMYSSIGLPQCRALKADLYDRLLRELDPDIVVAAQFAYEDRTQVQLLLDINGDRIGADVSTQALSAAARESVPKLIAGGADLVIIEPTPVTKPKFDPTGCLKRAKYLEACRYVVAVVPSGLEQFYRRLDRQSDQVVSADIDRLVCPWLPICDPVVGGRIVKVDAHHLTDEYSRSIAPDLVDLLRANHLL